MLRIVVYQSGNKEWRVRVSSPNGRILFVSSESYKRKAGALNALCALTDGFASGNVQVTHVPYPKERQP